MRLPGDTSTEAEAEATVRKWTKIDGQEVQHWRHARSDLHGREWSRSQCIWINVVVPEGEAFYMTAHSGHSECE
jgi:hypothetical protein